MRSTTPARIVLALALAGTTAAPAQIIINEVHLAGTGASPAYLGNWIEFWNQGTSPVDLAGWQVGLWSGDFGTVTQKTIPASASGDSVVYGRCFWLFESGGALGAALADPAFPPGTRGMRMGSLAIWLANSAAGCWLKNPQGQCVDYVYLRRLATAPPALPPNLPAGCSWTLGNLASTGANMGHVQRLTNVNHSSYADWGQDATANPGSPAAANATGAATQTSIGSCVAPMPVFQLNQATSNFDVDGLQGTIFAGAVTNRTFTLCAPGAVSVHFASVNLAQPYDAGIVIAPSVPVNAGGLLTGGGQIINVDLGNPSLLFLNGLSFAVPFPGSFTLPVSFGIALDISAQMVVTDPAQADGFALSQASQVHTIQTSGVVPGPVVDDGSVTVSLADPLLCAPGTMPFYAASWTQITVGSNGRVFMGALTDGDFNPQPATALTGAPFVGAWTDLSPQVAGSVQVTAPGTGLVRVAWNGVPYFGNATLVTNWSVTLDTVTAGVTIAGMNAFPLFPPSGTPGAYYNTQFLGLSPGGAGTATDPGPVSFVAGSNGGPTGAGMLYQFGQAGTLAGGQTASALASIVFTPTGTGNFTAYGY